MNTLRVACPLVLGCLLLCSACGDDGSAGPVVSPPLDASIDSWIPDHASPTDTTLDLPGDRPSEEGAVLEEAGPEAGLEASWDSWNEASEGSPPCGGSSQPCCAQYQCGAGLVCSAGACAVAVVPATCPPGASAAVFVSESAPPDTLEPWQEAYATVTFANCSGATWNATAASAADGYKLGGWDPQDNDTWGASRIALPADVPQGSQVTVGVVVRAPALTGKHGYAWSIVHEGVAWLSQPSPSHSLAVEAKPQTVEVCPGVQADIGGGVSASAQLQQCIEATASGGTLEIPAGIYRITGEVAINKPMTLRTQGTGTDPNGCLSSTGPKCAVLRADENLDVPRGFLRLGTTDHVVIDHLVLDGNRGVRLKSASAALCASGTNGAGFNASTPACTSCSFVRSGSARALCGTGFEWRGDNATFESNVFRDNGDHETKSLWADGLTVHQSDGAVVRNNQFIDNSDVGFILGGGKSALIQDNLVVQSHQAAFAGLMLDNFNGGTSGDFTGTTVSGNTIQCTAQRCDYALELGPHPWYLSANIIGGTVTQNTVTGGKININCEGAGTVASPMLVTQNVLGPAPAQASFQCGSKSTTAFNVSPDSHVDVGTGPSPTGSLEFHLCP